jgi:hypothetical protein
MLEGLVKYGIEVVVVALDGITSESYAVYRKRGDLNRVLDNVRKLNAYKKQYQSELPRLVCLWVVFGHNQHEIPQAMELAEELGMQFKPKMQWDSSYSPIIDPEQLKIDLGWEHSNREDYLSSTGDHYMQRACYQLWQSPKINWDGTVLGCCWTQQGFGGNAFEDGYELAINNEKIVYARRMLTGEAPARNDIPGGHRITQQFSLRFEPFLAGTGAQSTQYGPGGWRGTAPVWNTRANTAPIPVPSLACAAALLDTLPCDGHNTASHSARICCGYH